MVAVPADNAETNPVVALTVATETALLLHSPPAELEVKLVVPPTHRF